MLIKKKYNLGKMGLHKKVNRFHCILFTLFFVLFCSVSAMAQQMVTGTVTDSTTGNTLPGVNILVVGTSTGTATDANGHYSLSVPSLQDTLRFSFIGYETRKVPLNDRATINVKLASAIVAGQQLVVIGFGKQKQKNVTASIDTVNIAAVSSQPVISVGEGLEGHVAGVTIQSTGGEPGEDEHILIRGHRSLSAGNEPLIVVDGMPFSGSLSDISTQNIKSINVLKDAASTAIYGSRGANGVILITTKQGGNHPTNVSYDMYYGITQPLRRPDMMNGKQFAAMKREAFRSISENGTHIYTWKGTLPSYKEALKPKEYEGLKQGVSTNWPSLVLARGNRQNHHLSISGGNENTQFFISGNFLRDKALIPTNEFKRYGLRVNIKHQIGDKFNMGVSSSISRMDKDYNANPLHEALLDSPLGKPYDKNGNLIFLPINDGLRSNPLFNLKPGAKLDERRYNKVFATLFAQYDLLKNLTYRISFSPNYTDERIGKFLGSMTNQNRGSAPTASKSINQTFDYTLQNRLNYSTSFGESNHQLKILVLQSVERQHYESSMIDVRNLPFGSQKFNNLGTASAIESVGSGLSEWQLASFLGRISYNYKDRYLLQLNGRADGSSRLAPGHKWSFFPGGSIGWRITSEPFMEGVGFISNLKIRASYGEVGNTSISPYETEGTLARTTYVWGDTPAYGYRLANIANPNLGWEKTETYDVGLDFGFLNNRLSGSVDYYNAHTQNLLLSRQIPYTSGYGRILQNVGQTKNAGFEVSLKTNNVTTKSFSWTTDLNWSHYKEKIVKLFNKMQNDIGNQWFIGYPIKVFYDYKKIGIWQKNEVNQATKYGETPGQIKVKDQNNDGKINGVDRVILGSPEPNWTGGMTNTFDYKGLSLSVLVRVRAGGLLRSDFQTSYNTLFGRYNNLNVDYWTPNNPTNAYPRPNLNQQHPLYQSSMNIFNASYVQIKNVALGYNLPIGIMHRLGIDKLRIYISVENAYVFSPYKVKNPSASVNGVVKGTIPTPRAFVAGLNFSF
jgi:TonB-linked SusC/RagA family outer membrane protein